MEKDYLGEPFRVSSANMNSIDAQNLVKLIVEYPDCELNLCLEGKVVRSFGNPLGKEDKKYFDIKTYKEIKDYVPSE
ncbi:hypothetical protein GW932_03485 [archaeon]|nr:hypothetical protein [archaeon]